MQRFSACIDTLRRNGQGYLVPDDRPVHGIGHSNGALLHLLIGSIYAPASASNILISFNNKCVPILLKMSHHIHLCGSVHFVACRLLALLKAHMQESLLCLQASSRARYSSTC